MFKTFDSLGVLLCLLLSSQLVFADKTSFFPHDILIKPYSSLRIPPVLRKQTVVEAVKKIQSRKDLFYVDLGDYTDLMHGHVLYKFKNNNESLEPGQRLVEFKKNSPIWDKLEAVAVLFHSQEYRRFRNNDGYHGKFGELDPLDRNLLYLLQDSKYGKKGSVIDANIVDRFAIKKNERRKTVHSHHISESAFGASFEGMSVSFYFFKIECMPEINLKDSNVFKVEENGINTCLAIQSFYCRYHKCKDGDVVEHETRY